jgi:hypothetical protein
MICACERRRGVCAVKGRRFPLKQSTSLNGTVKSGFSAAWLRNASGCGEECGVGMRARNLIKMLKKDRKVRMQPALDTAHVNLGSEYVQLRLATCEAGMLACVGLVATVTTLGVGANRLGALEVTLKMRGRAWAIAQDGITGS